MNLKVVNIAWSYLYSSLYSLVWSEVVGQL